MRWRAQARWRSHLGVDGAAAALLARWLGLAACAAPAVLAGLTCQTAIAAPAAAGACELHVDPSREGATLAVQVLGAARRVDLTYLHSVTKTLVRETLAIDAEGFVQQRIEFLMPGPGLPTEALPGEVFERRPDRFVYDQMRRRIGPELLMRVDPAQVQTLEVPGQPPLALTRWGARGLRLTLHGCE